MDNPRIDYFMDEDAVPLTAEEKKEYGHMVDIESAKNILRANGFVFDDDEVTHRKE